MHYPVIQPPQTEKQKNVPRLLSTEGFSSSWRCVSLPMAAVIAAITLLCAGTEATAQIGLGDVGAATAIGEDMEAGTTARRAQDNDSAEAEGTPEAAPDTPAPARKAVGLDEWDDEHSIFRQEELAISWLKLLPVVLLLFLWVRSGDWVNRDAQIYRLGHEKWNTIMVAPFVIAFAVLMLVPIYLIGIILLTLAWFVPFILYVVHHNKSLEAHQSVLTGSWWRFQVGEVGKLFGLKIGGEKKADYLRGPEVDLLARGGDERTDQANLLTARQSPGYVHVKELIADMVGRGSSRVLMEYGQEAVGIRYMIDGVWHAGEPRDRDSGDIMLAVAKQLSNLNVSERKKKQVGEFGAEYRKKKYAAVVESQGVKTGERVVVSLRGGTMQAGFGSLEELGMREKLRNQWNEIMSAERGLVVYSAMPEGGLTTLTDVGLTETDRLMRDFVTIENIANPETDIENIPAHYYDGPKGESPSKLIPSLSRKYPAVWLVRDFVDADTAKLLMEEIDLDRLVVTTVQAGDVAEACLRLLKQKVPHKEFAQELLGVLNTRLIRKLCLTCRVEYEASPALLKKLGIPPGKVSKLYRPPNAEEADKPCKACAGLGYSGRTGLFELLVVDDQFRQKLRKEPKIDVLRKAARAAGMRTLQEEGVLLVAKGVTSLQELQRILKG